MNTIITEHTEQGDVSFDVFSRLIESRIIFLQGFISDATATDIAATLLYLDSQDDKEPISLYINAENGSPRAVFTIYDVMRLVSAPIKTYCIGAAIGEPALILAAGEKGSRFSTNGSFISLVQLEHFGSDVENMRNAEMMFEQSKRDNDQYLHALAHECGKNLKQLQKDTENILYLNAKEAKKYGVIDEIIGE